MTRSFGLGSIEETLNASLSTDPTETIDVILVCDARREGRMGAVIRKNLRAEL